MVSEDKLWSGLAQSGESGGTSSSSKPEREEKGSAASWAEQQVWRCLT